MAARERPEKLVVEIVAVGEHHHGRVGHGRLADDTAGVEGHAQALARALGVPDDSDAAVARVTSGLAAGLVDARRLDNLLGGLLQLRRPERLRHGHLHRVKLVVAGHLLDQRTAAVVLKHDEVSYQSEKAARLADASEHHLQLRQVGISQRLPRDRPPGLEPLPP